MNDKNTTTTDWETRKKISTRQMRNWSITWVISTAIATFGPSFIWHDMPILTVAMIVLNVIIGLVAIAAGRRQLQQMDELEQKIALEAASLALGVGVVLGLGYSMLDTSGVIGIHAEISHLIILLGLTYLIGTVMGKRKYQ